MGARQGRVMGPIFYLTQLELSLLFIKTAEIKC